MTYVIAPTSPQAASAAAFGRELVKACETRGVLRTELHRTTGIGRTALDNYRTGASLPKLEVARTLAVALEWPRLAEIVKRARTKTCARCGRPFHNDGGNQGAKRYCSPACREVARADAIASRRTRQAGQTGDGRRRYQALARLRSGIRIAEQRAAELQDAIAAMCADCEPEGLCRTPACPLRGFSPLPMARHEVEGRMRSELEVRRASWTPARREQQSRLTKQLHAEGRIPRLGTNHPAHDPARREAWLAACRAAKRSDTARRNVSRPWTPERREKHREALRAAWVRRKAAPIA